MTQDELMDEAQGLISPIVKPKIEEEKDITKYFTKSYLNAKSSFKFSANEKVSYSSFIIHDEFNHDRKARDVTTSKI